MVDRKVSKKNIQKNIQKIITKSLRSLQTEKKIFNFLINQYQIQLCLGQKCQNDRPMQNKRNIGKNQRNAHIQFLPPKIVRL
jgi:hypothetical protein